MIASSATKEGFVRLAAAAALASGLAVGVAAAAPSDAQAATRLGTPAITSVKVSSDSVTIKVKKVKGARSYMLYASTKGGDGDYYSTSFSIGKSGRLKTSDFIEGKTYKLSVGVFGVSKGCLLRSDSKPVRVKIKPVEHKITYHLEGGTLAEDVPTSFDRNTPTFELPEPTREGYVFQGWECSYRVDVDYFEVGNGFYDHTSTDLIRDVPQGFGQDLELRAQWREETEYDRPWLNEETLTGSEKLAVLGKRDRTLFYKELSYKFKKKGWGSCTFEVTRVEAEGTASKVYLHIGSSGWRSSDYVATVEDERVTFRTFS